MAKSLNLQEKNENELILIDNSVYSENMKKEIKYRISNVMIFNYSGV